MAIKFSKQQWLEMQPLVDQALSLPEAERDAFIQQRCADDPRMLAAILEVLSVQTPRDTLFAFKPPSSSTVSASQVGDVLGGYRLTDVLGQGGMGVVYLGERIQGDFSRKAAIKLLHSFAHDPSKRKQQLERFGLEQQTLAMLVHPQIAQLYDAGLTEEQQPYFVMEYVDGETILDYCKRRTLNLEQKVELIIQVANVLGFAHQNLVVHRDIKNSNILITDDGNVK